MLPSASSVRRAAGAVYSAPGPRQALAACLADARRASRHQHDLGRHFATILRSSIAHREPSTGVEDLSDGTDRGANLLSSMLAGEEESETSSVDGDPRGEDRRSVYVAVKQPCLDLTQPKGVADDHRHDTKSLGASRIQARRPRLR